MKQKYRVVDVWVQLALLTAWLLTAIIKVDYAINFYFITGTWFSLSLVIHRYIDKSRDSAYTIFLVLVAGIVAMVIVGLMSSIFFIILYLLLFWTPVVAVLYTIVCIIELKKLGKRPISLLK